MIWFRSRQRFFLHTIFLFLYQDKFHKRPVKKLAWRLSGWAFCRWRDPYPLPPWQHRVPFLWCSTWTYMVRHCRI